MLIRNGIKSTLRERGRTALFSLLIVLLTVTLILSLNVLLYCGAVTEACNKAYRSVALVEYMGAEYPNEDEPDPAARRAANALQDKDVLAVPGVTAWTRGSTAAAAVEGYERRVGTMPYGGRGVIITNNYSDAVCQWAETDLWGNPTTEEGALTYYTCVLQTALYSRSGREGVMIDVLAGDSGFAPERGKSYVLNGTFVNTSGSASSVGDYPMNGLTVFRVESFLGTDELPYAEYTGETGIPAAFTRAAEQYRTMNNYVRVVPCSDVNDVYVFQQNELPLTAGEMPDPGTPNECVITGDMAERLGIGPGDTFTAEELRGTENDRYYLLRTGKTESYTVSGVTENTHDYTGTVWVIAENADTPLFGYLLGTVSLENERAEEAVEALRTFVPEQVRVTLLDQGYGSAVQPFNEVKKTAVNVLTVCAAGVAAVLLLFAFLFVGRQNETVKIMVSLGTPGRKTALWFIAGALLVCGSSAVLGTILGTALRPAVLRAVAKTAAAAREEKGVLWYSETAVGIVKETSFDPKVPLWPNLLAALAIVALALLFCILFLRLARRSGTRKRGKSRVRVPHGETSVRGRGGLRFARLSIRRGGLRSLAVPVVSLILTVAVVFLGGIYQGWQNELDGALENTRIDGMVVSLDGRYYSGLFLSAGTVRTLLETEGVDDVSVSFGCRYWLDEDMPPFRDGVYGREHRQEWINEQPELVALNALAAAKEFYYADPNVTWLAGRDESVLADTYVKPLYLRSGAKAEETAIPAVCCTVFLEAHGLALGDTFPCSVQYETLGGYPREIPLLLQAVGSYVQQEGKANVYVPLCLHAPAELLTGGDAPEGIDEAQFARMENVLTFRTCRFYVASARELDAVRQRLREKNFSVVGRMLGDRTTLLLRDAAFLKFTENMERNIAMGRVMSAGISMLIVLLGFIISWLMIYSRRREFALMRGFGAKKRRVFASFFTEQAILSLTGCLIGCAALFRLYAGGLTQPLAVAAYLVCYLLGTAVSVLMIGKTDLMELLTVRD